MPIESKITRLTSALKGRWTRHASGHGPHLEVPPPVAPAAPEEIPAPAAPAPAPEADPFYQEVSAYLHDRIVARYDGKEGGMYMANDFNHLRRHVTTLKWVPVGPGRVIDPAAGTGLFPDMVRKFCGCEVEVPSFFNLEKQPAPYPDESSRRTGIVPPRVLEHFTVDPIYALIEANRILKPGGFLVLTTPNLASWVSLHNLINYETPYIFGLFMKYHNPDRHNREYTVHEVGKLAEAAGFGIERLEAITVYASHDAVAPIPGINPYNRGDTTFLLARKQGPVRDRYPAWLYQPWGLVVLCPESCTRRLP